MSNLQPKVFKKHLHLSEDQVMILAELFVDAGLDLAFSQTDKGKDCDGDFIEEWEDLEKQIFCWSGDKQ